MYTPAHFEKALVFGRGMCGLFGRIHNKGMEVSHTVQAMSFRGEAGQSFHPWAPTSNELPPLDLAAALRKRSRSMDNTADIDMPEIRKLIAYNNDSFD